LKGKRGERTIKEKEAVVKQLNSKRNIDVN